MFSLCRHEIKKYAYYNDLLLCTVAVYTETENMLTCTDDLTRLTNAHEVEPT
jgi:hypothetical protein